MVNNHFRAASANYTILKKLEAWRVDGSYAPCSQLLGAGAVCF
jgi:hypothetical protein